MLKSIGELNILESMSTFKEVSNRFVVQHAPRQRRMAFRILLVLLSDLTEQLRLSLPVDFYEELEALLNKYLPG